MQEILIKEHRDIELTEIINGVETMSPSPFYKHQKVLKNIFNLLDKFISKNKLGELIISPIDVILEEDYNVLQPDLVFIRKDNLSIIKDWVRGIPDLLIEIVSKGTVSRDTIDKKDIYEKYGVLEYWIVIPELESVEVLTLENKKYILYSSSEGEGKIESKVLHGLELDIKNIFEI